MRLLTVGPAVRLGLGLVLNYEDLISYSGHGKKSHFYKLGTGLV